MDFIMTEGTVVNHKTRVTYENGDYDFKWHKCKIEYVTTEDDDKANRLEMECGRLDYWTDVKSL